MGKPHPSEWLSLRQAADHLGVHPTTLRRWADAGDVNVLLTPGGHRRFTRQDLDRFAQDRRRLKTLPGLEQFWSEAAIAQTRRKLSNPENNTWLAPFGEADREQKRRLGRRLMGVLLQYISGSESDDVVLDEARAIGREHALNTLSLGLPLVDAMQALLFFRDTVVEVALDLPEIAQVRPEANMMLLRRINAALNAVQLVVADVYDKGR